MMSDLLKKLPFLLPLVFYIAGIFFSGLFPSHMILVLASFISFIFLTFFIIRKNYRYLYVLFAVLLFSAGYLRTLPVKASSKIIVRSGKVQYEKGYWFFTSISRKTFRHQKKILLLPPLKKKFKNTRGVFHMELVSIVPESNPGFPSYSFIMKSAGAAAAGRVLSVQYQRSLSKQTSKTGFKKVLSEFIMTNFRQPLAGFLLAVTTGNRGNLAPVLKNDFRLTGLSHLLAISGLHLGIYMLILFAISDFRFISPVVRNTMISAILFLYLGFIDFVPSMTRAVIMGLCYLWGYTLNKRVHRFHPLILSAFIIVLISPRQLYDIGFIFSFTAVTGILLFFPVLNRYFSRYAFYNIALLRYVLYSVILTFSAQILLFPAIINIFHEFSLIGFTANLIAVPLTFVIITLFGFALILNFIFPPLSVYVKESIDFTFYGLQTFLHIVSQWGEGIISMSSFTPAAMLFYFLTVYFFYRLLRKFNKANSLYFALSFTATFILFPAAESVFLLNMNQAASMMVGKKNVVIIDAGKDRFNFSRENFMPLILKNSGVKKVEGIYISHTDEDHAAQTAAIMHNYPQAVLYLSESALYFPDKLKKFLQRIPNLKKVKFIKTGYAAQYGNVSVLCLFPFAGYRPANINGTSLVLKLYYDNKQILYCGDVGKKELVKVNKLHAVLKSDVLIFPHHGSKYSLDTAFVNKVSPRLTLFSCGWHNRYHHPHKEVLNFLQQRKLEYAVTVREGCISL